VVYWLYTTIIRPSLANGALVWWPDVVTEAARGKLNKVQLLACLGITGSLHATPPSATEFLICLPPLDLVIQGVARMAAYGIWSPGCWPFKLPFKGHTTFLTRLQESEPTFAWEVTK
jgi:hypothetical protein